MKLFLNSIQDVERERVANAAGTTVGYLWQIAGRHRKPSALLSKNIEIATNKKVMRHELRPDIFDAS